jgi:hypothetical protein
MLQLAFSYYIDFSLVVTSLIVYLCVISVRTLIDSYVKELDMIISVQIPHPISNRWFKVESH